MSKVVCEVCGTAYAESANQCPICGTAKSESAAPVGGAEDAGTGYAYVKGGRFSQSNVRKHNSGKKELPRTTDEPKRRRPAPEEPAEEDKPVVSDAPKVRKERKAEKPKREEPENEQPSNIGLIIVVVVLLLAIISLCAYIAMRYIDLNNSRNESSSSSSSSGLNQPEEIPCTGVTIEGAKEHTFQYLTDSLLISISCQPADTTDMLNWNYDSTIVKVVQSGTQWIVCPVGPGETVITVSCGAFSDTISIISNAEPEPTDPEPTDPEPTDPEPTDPEFVLELTTSDFTLFYYGETAKIYNGTKDASEITWYSDNEEVATIENGVVSAVGHGNCNVYGVYGDQIVSCIVRCSKDVVKPVEADYYLYHSYGKLTSPDVTISVGENLTFSLRDKDGVKVTEGVTFYVSDETYITVNENGRITGVAPTGTKLVYLYVEYQGVTYQCRILVRST